jgi:hypothetical protein
MLDDIADNDEKQEEYDIFLKKLGVLDDILYSKNASWKGVLILFLL